MPDDHGKITREEFIQITGEDPLQPDPDEVRQLREELARAEADDDLRALRFDINTAEFERALRDTKEMLQRLADEGV